MPTHTRKGAPDVLISDKRGISLVFSSQNYSQIAVISYNNTIYMKRQQKKLRRVAVFDIDGTIFRSSLLIELVEALIQKGVFPESSTAHYREARANWQNRQDSYKKYISGIVAALEHSIRGVRYDDFFGVAEHVANIHAKHVYRYTRDLVRQLRRKKYFLLAISGSPKTILQPFCDQLGFHKTYGRMYEVDESGYLTGKILHESLVSDKAKILQRAVEKEHLTLEESIGVGDTEYDIPFLGMVKTPICFNPNQKLHDYAKQHGWSIVVERKDVIYEL